MRRMIVGISAVALLLMAGAAWAGEDSTQPVEAAAAFEQMKQLEGSWQVETPHGDGTINFRTASAGSVVIEEQFPGTDHEMMTVYHLDGDELVATHYCSAGNQPRFKLDRSSASTDRLHFAFAGGTNIGPGDGHIHEAIFQFVDADNVEAEWVFWSMGQEDHKGVFKMTRQTTE